MATPSSIPATMRAWQFSSTRGGLEKNLQLNTAAKLPPHDARALGQDKVLVQVLAMAVNPVDYKLAELPLVGRFAIKKPSSPGLDFAGRVAAKGEADSPVEVGQLVFGRLDQPTKFGTLAEYTVARSATLAWVPEGVEIQNAACLGTAALTAYQCIEPNVKKGDGSRVFINGGSGGTGCWGIQIAKQLGCYVVTSCSGKNEQLCRSLGADEVLDYTKTDVLEALKESASFGQKFDLVVDNVGNSNALYWQCHRFTSPGAKYVQVGTKIGGTSGLSMVLKRIWPSFLGGGKRDYQIMMVQSDKGQLEQIGKWMLQGKVKPVVDQVFPMQDAPKAFERLKTSRAKGKIVVTVKEG